MKTHKLSFFVAALLTGMTATFGFAQQDREEVPGDNFSLEGALELFKKSASPQEFEQLLNSPDSKVNNLDLNGDGSIDYIKVIDRNDGNVHAFILQSVISQAEYQDIAVIELEKRNDGSAVLQIVGDADIYGIETIIEPTQEVRVNAGYSTARTTVNVWAWPSVQYVYSPYYSVWASPWGWGAYPGWYRPWRPVAYYVYSPWWTPYRPYYALCYSHRVFYASRIYNPYRTTSVIVYNRHQSQISHYRSVNTGYRSDRGNPINHNRYDSRNSSYSSSSRSNRYDNQRSNSNSSRSNNGRQGNDSYSTPSRGNSDNQRSQRSEQQSQDRSRTQQRSSDRNGTFQRSSPNISNDRQSNPVNRPSMPQRGNNGGSFSQRSSEPRQSAPARQSHSGVSQSPTRSAPAHRSGGGSGGSGGSNGGGGGSHRGRH